MKNGIFVMLVSIISILAGYYLAESETDHSHDKVYVYTIYSSDAYGVKEVMNGERASRVYSADTGEIVQIQEYIGPPGSDTLLVLINPTDTELFEASNIFVRTLTKIAEEI